MKTKFELHDVVHINGTSGIGRVIFIEYTGRLYRYTVLYSDGKRKTADETELIKVQ